MSVPTYLDAAAVGLPAVLGMLGVWLGFGRLLVSWPMRWFVSSLGALIAAMLAALHLIVHRELAALLHLSGTIVTTVVSVAVSFIALVMLLMFMSNLRERVVVWIGPRRVGSMERVFGGLFGIACGLLLVVGLVVLPHMLYESMRPDRNNDPPWIRESLSLPYVKRAGDAMKSALMSFVPAANGKPQ